MFELNHITDAHVSAHSPHFALTIFNCALHQHLSYLPTTTTMFAAAFNYLFTTRTTRRNARIEARANPVAAPTVLRPDRRTRAPTYETSSNRVGFGQAMVRSLDIRDVPNAETYAFRTHSLDKNMVKELACSFDGNYWSRPSTRRAPVRRDSSEL
jgi:hypothetical protein